MNIDPAEAIEDIIRKIGEQYRKLDGLAEQKAEANAKYDSMLAKTIVQLKAGKKFILDGEEVVKPAVTIMEKIAKGICWNKRLQLEKANAQWTACLKILDALEAQKNAFQSLLKL